MRAALALYRFALRALPRRARDVARDDMIRTFERLAHRARERGPLALAWLTVAETLNLLAVGLAERAASLGLPPFRPLVRSLARRRGYAAGVVGTLALGVCAAASMFAVTDAVAFRALPVPEAERLVHVWSHTPGGDNTIPSTDVRSFLAWRGLDDVFTGLEGLHFDTRVLTGDGPPVQIDVAVVTPGLLPLIGVDPALGRHFLDTEGLGGDAYVLVSHGLWRSRWGAERGLLGRTVELNGRPHTVLGVMPDGFRFPDGSTDAWIPLAASPSALLPAEGPPPVPGFDVLARLRPGVEMEAANAALETRGPDLVAAGAPDGTVPRLFDMGFFLTPERTRDTLVLLLGAVLLVLLVALINAVALALSQAVDRAPELAVRQAIGAGRGRLFTELLAENLILAIAGAALGLVVADLLLGALLPRIPIELRINTWGQDVSVWPSALPFAAAAAAGVALLASLLTHAPRATPGRHLGDARTHSQTRGGHRLQQALLAGQMALAIVLLSGLSLVSASVLRLERVDSGMDAERLLLVSLRIPTETMLGSGGAETPAGERAALFDQRFVELEAALRAVPGVVAVSSTTSPLPLSRARFRPELETPERPPLARGDSALSGPAFAGAQFLPMLEVAEGFFDAAGIRIVEGRAFTASDDPSSAVVVNEVIARGLWPEGSAVGQLVRMSENDPWLTVVGVTAPIALMSPRDQWGNGAEIFVPLDRTRFGVYRTFVLRTDGGDPRAIEGAVREAVWSVDPVQPIERLLPMDAAYGSSIGRERFFVTLLAVFAALTTAVAAAGVYALLSRHLARRRREVGIRIALGARPAQVVSRVAGSGLLPSAVGTLLGLTAAVPLSRFLQDILFEVRPGDPASLAAAAGVLMSVAALACVRPAAQALRTDVVEAIRGE